MNDTAHQAHLIQAEITTLTMATIRALDILVPLALTPPSRHDLQHLRDAAEDNQQITPGPGALMLVHHHGRDRVAVIRRLTGPRITGFYLTSTALAAAESTWHATAAYLRPDYPETAARAARAHAAAKLDHYRTLGALTMQQLAQRNGLTGRQVTAKAREITSWLNHHDNTYPEHAYRERLIQAAAVRAVAQHREHDRPWAAAATLCPAASHRSYVRLTSPAILRDLGLLPTTTTTTGSTR